MSELGDLHHMVMAKDARVVIAIPGDDVVRAPMEVTEIASSHGGMTLDDDFEPVEAEGGTFLRFECHGDSRVRRFFRSRSVIDSETFAPREHEWTLEHGGAESPTLVTFSGRLYDYDPHTVNASKAVVIRGRIRISQGEVG